MSDTCFCTLALGAEFTEHARRLATDLARFAPDTPLVVLSDFPEHLAGTSSAVVVPHHQVSAIRPYHDKRIVVERALERFERCVFVDADARLFAPVPQDWLDRIPAGIAARNSLPFSSKYAEELRFRATERSLGLNPVERRWGLLRRGAERLGVDPMQTTFVQEYFFSVTRAGGHERDFLDAWAGLARFLELHLFSWGEGYSIGLAAACAGWQVEALAPAETWLFKDQISRRRQHKGETLGDVERQLLEERAVVARSFARSGLGAMLGTLTRNGGIALRYARLVAGALLSRDVVAGTRARGHGSALARREL